MPTITGEILFKKMLKEVVKERIKGVCESGKGQWKEQFLS